MSLVNDYFLLYHGSHYENCESLSFYGDDQELLSEISALILSTNRKNFPKYLALPSFNDFVKQISKNRFSSIEDLYSLQSHLIKYIETNGSEQYIYKLHTSFKYLEKHELLSTQNCEKLLSLFDPHEFKSFEEVESLDEEAIHKDFLEQKEDLQVFINELKSLGDNLSFCNELQDIQDYLNKQIFSIGITGVMNAGKSTLLNALMGKEVLGTSVVPETANLSLLKYTKEPYARVFYWSKKQWEKIRYSAQEFESIALFVQESEEAFKDEFDAYICEESRVDEINIENLSLYTSAQHNKSNLIEKIELGVDLEFLKEGIEIVDTPGLDDVVIQREEITKEYLSQCDLMIHLMNVSQSATQKDIDFIINALIYDNIGKLLIVLTKADSVSESELQEVIKYTQKSIKTQLIQRDETSKLDFILSNLEFISVSSTFALMHKTGKAEEALAKGYSLEKTGLLKLENYLYETLYGPHSQRGELIINSAKINLLQSIKMQTSSLQYELRLLSKSEDEIAKELELLNLKKEENSKKIKEMKEMLRSSKEELIDLANSLDSFIQAQVFAARSRLESRLMDDFTYALEEKKTKEFLKNLQAALDLALKDTLIDVIRDYRYKFIQKSESLAKKMHLEYESYEVVDNEEAQESGVESINKYFKTGMVASSSYVLHSKLQKSFSKANKKELSSLAQELQEHLKEAYSQVYDDINEKVKILSQGLIEELYQNLSNPLDRFEKSLEEEERILSDNLIHYENDEGKRGSHSLEVHKQLKHLVKATKRCQL